MKVRDMSSFSDSFLSTFSIWLQWLAVIGMFLGLVCAAAIIPVRREMASRQSRQLTEAHGKIDALQPKPFRVRLRTLLEQIDVKIIPALREGRRDFDGGIPASQYVDLERLASEQGASEFIKIDPNVRMGIGMGPQGTTYGVTFHLDPKIVDE